MAEAIMILAALAVLFIWFWPRRSSFVRHVTKSYNGQHYGKGRELY